MYVIVVAWHHPLFCCMDASLLTTPFGTSIPTSFNIVNEKFFTLVLLFFYYANPFTQAPPHYTPARLSPTFI